MADEDIELETINEKLRRFRNAPPMSRQERFKQFGESKPLWWEDSSSEFNVKARKGDEMLSSVESFGQSLESAQPLGMSTIPVPSIPPLRRGESDKIDFKKGRTADVASLKDDLIGYSISSPDKATYKKNSRIIGGRSSGESNIADSSESITVIKKTLVSGVDGSHELDGMGNSRGRGTARNYERGLEQALNEGGEGYKRDLTGALRTNKPGGDAGELDASALIAKRNFERDMESSSSLGLSVGEFALDLGASASLRMPDFTLTGQTPRDDRVDKNSYNSTAKYSSDFGSEPLSVATLGSSQNIPGEKSDGLRVSIPELDGVAQDLTGLVAHLKESEQRINGILNGSEGSHTGTSITGQDINDKDKGEKKREKEDKEKEEEKEKKKEE